MRLGSCGGGGARVCMCWDGRGGVQGGRSESEWVGIGLNWGFSDRWLGLLWEGIFCCRLQLGYVEYQVD